MINYLPFSLTPWSLDVEYSRLFFKEFKELSWLNLSDLEREFQMHVEAKKILPTNVPGIVGIYSYGKGKWVYCQEKVNGITSNEYLSKHPEDIDMIISQIKSILKVLNDRGFCHNDTHGGNFMVEETTKKIWVIDFGMSDIGSGKYDDYIEFGISQPGTNKKKFIDVKTDKDGTHTVLTSSRVCDNPKLSHYVKHKKNRKAYLHIAKMDSVVSRKLLKDSRMEKFVLKSNFN